MIDETEPQVESDLRRRAAWLLGMLALVAILVVVVMTALLGSGGSKHNADNPAPLDSVLSTPHTSPATTARHSSPSTAPRTAPRTRPAKKHSSSRTSKSATPTPPARRVDCAGQQPCAQDGDIGDAIGAINAYRTAHGQSSVPGSVSRAAIQCAVSNGGDCSGSWAESQVAKASGKAAVHKVVDFGKLLDPQMKSFEVGWAYDPGGKQYLFAIVRND